MPEYLEIAGEYLTKVYSGSDYFKHYDYFAGNIILEKFELICKKSNIVLPIQFQRVPFIFRLKKSIKCTQIKVSFNLHENYS